MSPRSPNTGALLSRHAQEHGHRPALIRDDRVCTFAGLDRRANRAAGLLRSLGVRKGDRVALYAPNSLAWVEIFFGASRLGAPLVPLGARLRAAELTRLVAHSRPAVLVFAATLRDEVDRSRPALPGALRFIETDSGGATPPWALNYDAGAATVDATEPAADVRLEDLHSICYTAGTTGVPRGAMLTHANIVIGTHEMSLRSFGYSDADVFLNATPLAHRAGCARLIQSIGVGAAQVLVPRFDPEETLRLIERHRVTLVGLVPTMIRMIDRAGVASRFDLSSLRTIIATGEACPPDVRRRVFELFPRARLLSLYASTEAGQIALLPSADQLRRPTATGRPLDGVEVRILDDEGRALGPGETGEIAVRTGQPGTSGVMLGYVEGPEAGAFADGWFRTGDCGRLDEEGYLYLSDRRRDMILSGGLNIASREVEETLLEHPGVAEAAVVGVPDPTWGEAVVAVVVRAPGTPASADDLIAHCRARLASYKKPRAVRFADALPRNAAGKVSKYLLREQLAAGAAGSSGDKPREAGHP